MTKDTPVAQNTRLLDSDLLHRHTTVVGEDYNQLYRNLRFSGPGASRFWSTVGYFHAVIEHGGEDKVKLATNVLMELDRYLSWYNSFGGYLEEDGAHNVPAYKYELRDDGCWGSFGFVAYKVVPLKAMNEYCDKNSLSITAAVEKLECPSVFNEYRSGNYYYYTRSFNGGLIFHKGKDGDILTGSYGSHT